jgi:glycosyltransferase involved in cell wall biosynthesis
MVKMPDDQYRKMQSAARNKIETNYSPEVVGKRLKQIFESITQK